MNSRTNTNTNNVRRREQSRKAAQPVPKKGLLQKIKEFFTK